MIFRWSVVLAALGLFSCETIIQPQLEEAEPVLVVDAWINNRSEEQIIRLSTTLGYFDNQDLPGVVNAQVTVRNETSARDFIFLHQGSGIYRWLPASADDSLGTTNDVFSLEVQTPLGDYAAASKSGRVPVIDSISFITEPASGLLPEITVAEFWSVDPAGKGDTYWIKAWRNDTLLLKPSEINLAYDAGFSEGGNYDGGPFITPKRRGVTPFDADEDGNVINPFDPGDSLYVEIHSITRPAFDFLNEVIIQTNRPGGFQELFAAPAENVGTNIQPENASTPPAVGFFNVASVSGFGKRYRKK